jgi:glycosyltransferase involved in cell wall biosynthesis
VVPGKGHDVLVAALASVADRTWRATCVGSLERAPDFVAEVRGRAACLGIGERIAFAGPLTGDRLVASYGAADLLVLPTRSESFGMVVTEAIAHGVPVVASDVGGVAEALGVAPGRTTPGMLVPPADPEALGAALAAWLDDAHRRGQWRDAARARRTCLHGWDETSAQVVRVLEGVAG